MNLITWAVWGIIVLAIFAVIDNSGATSIANINDQFAKLSCPMPLYNYVDFGNGTITNSDVVKNTGKNYGSTYQCFYDSHSVPPSTHMTISYVNFNATTFTAFPNGWFSWLGGMVGAVFTKVSAGLTLCAYVLTPINMNILGYGLSNLSGVVLMVVIITFILCYIPIGIFFYQVVIPKLPIIG